MIAAVSVVMAGEIGTADLLILSVPGSPSVMMYGSAGTALVAGPESVSGNPSMLESGFTASGGRWNLESTVVSAAAAFTPVSDIRAGLGITYLGKGGIIRRDEAGVVQGEYSFSTGFLVTGISCPISERLSAGASVGFSWESIGGDGGTGFVANAGMAYNFHGRLRAGAVISSLGSSPSWSGIHKDMPTEVSVGVSCGIMEFFSCFGGGRIGFSTADAFSGGISIEYSGFGCTAGYQYSPDQGEISGLFGGLRYTYISNGTYTVEAAFAQRDQLQWPVIAGLSVAL